MPSPLCSTDVNGTQCSNCRPSDQLTFHPQGSAPRRSVINVPSHLKWTAGLRVDRKNSERLDCLLHQQLFNCHEKCCEPLQKRSARLVHQLATNDPFRPPQTRRRSQRHPFAQRVSKLSTIPHPRRRSFVDCQLISQSRTPMLLPA